MGSVYRTLANYEPLVYIALAIGGLFAFRRMWLSWREWRDSVYGLEREFALRRLGQATAVALFILGLLFAEFFIATFIAPSLPASDLLATPTLDLLVTPAGTLSPGSTGLAVTQPVPNGMSGCAPDKTMITSPKPGEDISGTIKITGTADVPNFAFYKYEVASMGTQNWATIAAKQAPVKNAELGEWNTLPFANGDYFLRLVIVDNVGTSLEPCVIAVRVLNQ
jgi:hypothetical protein